MSHQTLYCVSIVWERRFSADSNIMGLLPPLFVKAYKGFTYLLLKRLELVLGGHQSFYCFLIIRTLLRWKVKASAVTIMNGFVFSQLNTWAATVPAIMYWSTVVVVALMSYQFFQYIWKLKNFRSLPYTACFPCSAAAVVVSVALHPLFQGVVNLPVFASSAFKHTQKPHLCAAATYRVGMHIQ